MVCNSGWHPFFLANTTVKNFLFPLIPPSHCGFQKMYSGYVFHHIIKRKKKTTHTYMISHQENRFTYMLLESVYILCIDYNDYLHNIRAYSYKQYTTNMCSFCFFSYTRITSIIYVIIMYYYVYIVIIYIHFYSCGIYIYYISII